MIAARRFGDFGRFVVKVFVVFSLSILAISGLDNGTAQAQHVISGAVFEDINYGGGSGRDLSTADDGA